MHRSGWGEGALTAEEGLWGRVRGARACGARARTGVHILTAMTVGARPLAARRRPTTAIIAKLWNLEPHIVAVVVLVATGRVVPNVSSGPLPSFASPPVGHTRVPPTIMTTELPYSPEVLALWNEKDEEASEKWRQEKVKDFEASGPTKEKYETMEKLQEWMTEKACQHVKGRQNSPVAACLEGYCVLRSTLRTPEASKSRSASFLRLGRCRKAGPEPLGFHCTFRRAGVRGQRDQGQDAQDPRQPQGLLRHDHRRRARRAHHDAAARQHGRVPCLRHDTRGHLSLQKLARWLVVALRA